MNELTLALIKANNIITETYGRWDAGKSMRAQADNHYRARKRDLNVKTAAPMAITLIVASVAGLVPAGLAAAIFDSFPMVLLSLFLSGGITVAAMAIVYVRFVQPSTAKDGIKIKNEYNAAVRQAEEMYNSGTEYLNANLSDLIFLPNSYWYPLATGYLVKTVQEQRAATLQEALDKYDEQLHRWTLEANQQQILQQQRVQSRQLDNINSSINFNTAVTAAGFAADILTRL